MVESNKIHDTLRRSKLFTVTYKHTPITHTHINARARANEIARTICKIRDTHIHVHMPNDIIVCIKKEMFVAAVATVVCLVFAVCCGQREYYNLLLNAVESFALY